MVLQNQTPKTSRPYFFVCALIFALFLPTVLSFLPNSPKPDSFRLTSPAQAAGHWRATRRIYPNQLASAKSAIEVCFNLHPHQMSPDRILRVVVNHKGSIPSLTRWTPAVLFPVLRI